MMTLDGHYLFNLPTIAGSREMGKLITTDYTMSVLILAVMLGLDLQ
jgi:hypothetical protein